MIKIKNIYVVEDDKKNMKLFKRIISTLTPLRNQISYYDAVRTLNNIELVPYKIVNDPKITVYTALEGDIGFKLITSKKLTVNNNGDYSKKVLKKADLIVLDIRLPEMSGVDICYKLRKMEEFHSTPIIAVTAYAQVGDKDTIMNAGFNRYVSKPLDVEKFIAVLKEELNYT